MGKRKCCNPCKRKHKRNIKNSQLIRVTANNISKYQQEFPRFAWKIGLFVCDGCRLSRRDKKVETNNIAGIITLYDLLFQFFKLSFDWRFL